MISHIEKEASGFRTRFDDALLDGVVVTHAFSYVDWDYPTGRIANDKVCIGMASHRYVFLNVSSTYSNQKMLSDTVCTWKRKDGIYYPWLLWMEENISMIIHGTLNVCKRLQAPTDQDQRNLVSLARLFIRNNSIDTREIHSLISSVQISSAVCIRK